MSPATLPPKRIASEPTGSTMSIQASKMKATESQQASREHLRDLQHHVVTDAMENRVPHEQEEVRRRIQLGLDGDGRVAQDGEL